MVDRVRVCGAAGSARGAGERRRVGMAYDGTMTREGRMGSTTAASAFVGIDVAHPAKTPVRAVREFLDWAVRFSRDRYRMATTREGVRAQLHRFGRVHAIDRARSDAHAESAPTITLVRQILQLWQAGATPAELRLIAETPLRMVDALLAEHVSCLRKLDQAEQGLDGHEDVLQLRRHLQPSTPQSLRDEAAVVAAQASLYHERERALLAEASRLERGGLCA